MEGSTREGTAETIVTPLGTLTLTHHTKRLTIGWLWTIITFQLGLAILAASITTMPYFAIAPGSAPAVTALIQVPKEFNHPPQGQVLFPTVSLSRVRLIDAVRGWLDPNIDVVPEERILGPTPRKDFRQQNIQEMDDSKLIAEVVALRKLGYNVPERGAGALVNTVAAKSPADGHLKPGDVITAIDGKAIALASELVAALAPRKFGETVTLTVVTGDKPARTETIKLGGSNEDKSKCSATEAFTGKGCLGVQLNTKSHQFDRPVNIVIDTAGIGGPSAGLAFVLGIMDQLRPGELTGGHKVAATGTIDLNGVVGDVGGVAQKTAVVRSQGVEYFLVPPGEYDAALAHAGDKLKVIRVATLDEALAALGRIGGDLAALAPPTTVKSRTR